MINVRALAFAYDAGRNIFFPDVDVAKGEACLLLGESGSGKTTWLHLLGGLLRAQKGSIHINETDITKLSETEMDRFRGKHIGFVFQKNHLISALTVKQNILMAPFLAGVKADHVRLEQVLEQLDLSDKKNAPIHAISHGQAQRVAIARAIINHPTVIFADEPTSALDDTNCARVIGLLQQAAAQQQATLVIATHDHRLKAHISNQIELRNESVKSVH